MLYSPYVFSADASIQTLVLVPGKSLEDIQQLIDRLWTVSNSLNSPITALISAEPEPAPAEFPVPGNPSHVITHTPCRKSFVFFR